MATLADVTKQLSESTSESVAETKKLNKSNVTLRGNVVDLKTAVQNSAKATSRVEFLESLLDKNNVGLADTFKDTLMGPLGSLADAIPGKAFLMPFLKLAAQRTPLKGILERRRDTARDKLQTTKATTAIEQSGAKFGNEEEKQAAIERLKLEMQKKEQEVQIAEKNKQISEMLGLEIDKFDSIVGKTEEVKEKTEELAEGGGGTGAAVVGGVIKSIGKGFKYLGNNLKAIAKGALAMALMGASLIPFALAAIKFNEVEWESLGKAGAALLGLAGVAFILGKASGSMITGSIAIAILGGALYAAGLGFKQFQDLDWETIGMGFVAIAGLGAIGAVVGLAAPLIGAGALAIGAMGVALIPFAYAAQLAAPAMTEIAESFGLFADVPITTMMAIPAALAAVGVALAAMSATNFVGGILDGIGKLFGNESPIDKIVKMADAAPNIIALGTAMQSFGDDVDAMMAGLERLDPAKVDKLDDFSDKIENFVDSMPGVIGTAKIAAFAAAFASIAASAGIAPAVASGVEAATGEVIAVQENPRKYVEGKGASQEVATSVDTPDGKVRVKYKGESVLVDAEDVEKVKAIDAEMQRIAEQRASLKEEHDSLPFYKKVKKKRIKDQDRQLMGKQQQLEKDREVAIAQATGDDRKINSVRGDKQAIVDAMASGRSTKLNQAQAENTELADASTGNTLVSAPVTTINNTQGGGGGSSNVIPIPIGEPDPKTKAMIANNF